MGKHVLFLIHGMGSFESDWAEKPDGPVATLKRVAKKYDYYKQKSIDDVIRFAPITYDKIFCEAVAKWEADSTAGLEHWDSESERKAVLKWLDDAGNPGTFWWTHAADVVMYRLSGFYRRRVLTHVVREMARVLQDEWSSEDRALCSVLAHSLGTAVAHDSMHLLGTVRWGGTHALRPENWHFNTVFMVSNTSHLLEHNDTGTCPAYESIVRPGSYCARYWNFRHKYDAVALARQFEGPDDWDEYYDVEVDHFRGINIHGISHYLEHPAVHIPILRIVNPGAVSAVEEAREIAGFQRFADMPAGTDEGVLEQELQNVVRGIEGDLGIREWIALIMKFGSVVEGRQ